MYRLTDNFTLPEFTKSAVALRHGIDNIPNREEKQNLLLLAKEVLQPVREHYGRIVKISSGFRCLELNRKLGSNDSSSHPKGEASDFEIPGFSNFELAKWISTNLDYDQCILEFFDDSLGYLNSGWVHTSYSRTGNRREMLTIARDNNRKIITLPGIVKYNP